MTAPVPPLPPLNLNGGHAGPAVSGGGGQSVYANWNPAPWNPLGSRSAVGLPVLLVIAVAVGGFYFMRKKL
ncbi:hypothetical protein ACQU0X_27970 [Pseudovibrio ascidiaceicola]|uniref:hypothetical protein n=1 Tax=Pseudovibrio ascidiaceicola TaxID=285279 RepID=UPI003D362782